MAILRKSSSLFLVALLVAAILVSSSHSSKDDLGEMKAVIEPMDITKCDVLAECNYRSCTTHCFGGIINGGDGFCNPLPDNNTEVKSCTEDIVRSFFGVRGSDICCRALEVAGAGCYRAVFSGSPFADVYPTILGNVCGLAAGSISHSPGA